jgi:hypothetical protein
MSVYNLIVDKSIKKIKLSSFADLFLKIAAQMSISLFLAFISISQLARDSAKIQDSIRSGLPALDEWYYQKIYFFSESLMDFNQPFVDSANFATRNLEVLNFGDLFYRIIFKFFPYDISISYFVSTIILLTLWIYFISTLVVSSGKNNYLFSASISVILILLFFGNSRLPNNEYPFARIVSPQLVGLVWVLATLLILKAIDNESRLSKSKGLVFFSFSFLVFFASFTYLYLLLSILGALFALTLNLLESRRFEKALILILSSAVGCTPYLLSSLQKIDETRFIEAGLRMGLVESRAPGGGLTIMLCLLCLLVLNSSKVTKLNLQNPIKKTLNLSSLGILLASLSNLFTNVSIQFSYHFEIFALLNCLIVSSLILKKLLDRVPLNIRPRSHIKIFVTFFLMLLPVILFTSQDFKSSERDLREIQKNMQVKFGDSSNLIVDVKGLQSTLRVYSKARILYQEDIIPYGYTNNEILERYFISTGCSDDLNNDSMLRPLVYYIEASKQKGESLQKYLNMMNLESRFSYLYEPLLNTSRSRNESVIKIIKDLRINLKPSNCLEYAQKKNIGFIIFDQNSKWSKILDDKSIVKNYLGLEGIFYARI